jgi:glucosamine-6-phosphate deaminase
VRRSRGRDHEPPNPDFRIRVVDSDSDFYRAFAEDIVSRIRQARDEEAVRRHLSVGPMPQHSIAAEMINASASARPRAHVQHGRVRRRGGRDRAALLARLLSARDVERFFDLVDPALRPAEEQIHFRRRRRSATTRRGSRTWAAPTSATAASAGAVTSLLGVAPRYEFAGDLEAYKQAGARLVELHPMTIMQNALHSFGGDWSWVPPRANTIGPREILGAKYRSFWLDGDLGGGVSWQRFIARLVAHGPVSSWSRARSSRPAAPTTRSWRRRRRRRDPHGVIPQERGARVARFG